MLMVAIHSRFKSPPVRAALSVRVWSEFLTVTRGPRPLPHAVSPSGSPVPVVLPQDRRVSRASDHRLRCHSPGLDSKQSPEASLPLPSATRLR